QPRPERAAGLPARPHERGRWVTDGCRIRLHPQRSAPCRRPPARGEIMSEKPDWRIQWLVAQAKDERLTDAEVRSIIANFPRDPAPAMTPDNLREAVIAAIELCCLKWGRTDASFDSFRHQIARTADA